MGKFYISVWGSLYIGMGKFIYRYGEAKIKKSLFINTYCNIGMGKHFDFFCYCKNAVYQSLRKFFLPFLHII